jgi:hypothetical protein
MTQDSAATQIGLSEASEPDGRVSGAPAECMIVRR